MASSGTTPAIGACTVCGVADSKACSRCAAVWYCGVVHQKSDWKTHKNVCVSSSKPRGTLVSHMAPSALAAAAAAIAASTSQQSSIHTITTSSSSSIANDGPGGISSDEAQLEHGYAIFEQIQKLRDTSLKAATAAELATAKQSFTRALDLFRSITSSQLLAHKKVMNMRAACWSGRSSIHAKLNIPQLALWDAIESVRVDSDWLDGYLKLGQAAASLQDHSRAVQAFTLVVSQLAEGSSQRSVVDALLATSNEFTKKNNSDSKSSTAVAQSNNVFYSRLVNTRGLFTPEYFTQNASYFNQLPYSPRLRSRAFVVCRQDGVTGRGLFADKNFDKGDIIMIEEPFVSVSLSDDLCGHCQRPLVARPIQCRRHRDNSCTERYCNATCSEHAWDTWHRSLCGMATKELRVKCRPVDSPSAKAPLYLVKIAGMTLQNSKYPCSSMEIPELCHLMDWGDLPATICEKLSRGPFEGRVSMLEAVRIAANLYDHPQFDMEWLEQCLHRIYVNSFSIARDAEDPDLELRGGVASGMYQVMSFLNHSCVPNAQIEFDLKNRGNVAVVRARRKIKRGEQIYNSYLGYAAAGGEVASVSERAQRLSTYGFKCHCKLCTTQESSIDVKTHALLADLGL